MVWRFWSTASCEEAATAEPTEAPAAEEVAVVEEEVVVEVRGRNATLLVFPSRRAAQPGSPRLG